ncbi:GAF and ANTAR domain-containing protein [Arthrobacter sp. R4-81]
MDTPEEMDDFERLQDLVAEMGDIKGFLDGMTGLAADALTRGSGTRIECAVTLKRRKRSNTIAGSSDDAIILDGIEQRLGDGPCLQALRTGTPVLLGDVSSDPRWSQFAQELADKDFRSALGVPLDLGGNASALLNFFAVDTGIFNEDIVAEAQRFADVAGRALRLGVRIAAAELKAQDLSAALDSRTVIDLARGVIMAQNRCTADEAFEILRRVSSNRNEKLHDVAGGVISGITGTTGKTHFEP